MVRTAGALQPDRVGEHLVATALTDDPRILPALLVSAGAGQPYQALSVLARALANPSIAADLRDRLGEQLRDVITMGVEGAALTGIVLRNSPGQLADAASGLVSPRASRRLVSSWMSP